MSDSWSLSWVNIIKWNKENPIIQKTFLNKYANSYVKQSWLYEMGKKHRYISLFRCHFEVTEDLIFTKDFQSSRKVLRLDSSAYSPNKLPPCWASVHTFMPSDNTSSLTHSSVYPTLGKVCVYVWRFERNGGPQPLNGNLWYIFFLSYENDVFEHNSTTKDKQSFKLIKANIMFC